MITQPRIYTILYMTTTSPSMDHSDPSTPDTSMEVHDTSTRRKSGRARQAPVLLSQDPKLTQRPVNGAKRKWTELRGGGSPNVWNEEDSNDESDEDESDPDEEELKDRRKKASKKVASKPAPKRSKTAGPTTTNLAVRPAANGVRKASRAPKSKARPSGAAAVDGSGLFGWCFHKNLSPDFCLLAL